MLGQGRQLPLADRRDRANHPRRESVVRDQKPQKHPHGGGGRAQNDGFSLAACSRMKSKMACGVTFAISNVPVPNTVLTNRLAWRKYWARVPGISPATCWR